VIATTDFHQAYVRSQDIGFVPMHPLEAQLGPPAPHIEKLFDPVRGPAYLVKSLIMPYVREAYDDLLAATFDADVLVTHPLAVAGPLVAQKTGIPWASLVLAPLNLFSAIDAPIYPGAPLLGWTRKLGVIPHRLAFALVKRMARGWERPLEALRQELDLPHGPAALFDGQFSPSLNLALFSPLISAPMPDWPASTLVCGFARHDGAMPPAATQDALESFLEAGEPPLVFTLGSSAHVVARGFWLAAAAAAQRLGRRAMLIGNGAADAVPATERVAAFDYLPYSMVFPRAAAVVHQGGIGTLSQALAAGRPQLVLPVAFDQFDNAARAVSLGVARSMPFRQAAAPLLERELTELLDTERYESAARPRGDWVRSENGAVRAADAILALV
jgi:rhamnosyltransferase subunit B